MQSTRAGRRRAGFSPFNDDEEEVLVEGSCVLQVDKSFEVRLAMTVGRQQT